MLEPILVFLCLLVFELEAHTRQMDRSTDGQPVAAAERATGQLCQ